MLFLSFAEAWRTYLYARPRLPSYPPVVNPQRVSGLIEAVGRGNHQLVVFDAYGVLHTGGEGFASAQAALIELRRRGVATCVVTNDVTHDATEVAAGLARRGYDFAPEDVISGRSLLPAVLAGAQGEGTFGLVASHPEAMVDQFPRLVPLGLDAAAYDAVDGVLFVDTNHWTDAHAELLERSLIARPRPMVVCNPDVGCPYNGQISAEPGYFAHRIAAQGGKDPIFLGKPFPAIYQRVMDRFPDIPAASMLMVGDSPHTDILGARRLGMRCLLVEGGFLSGFDALAHCQEAKLLPDYIARQA